MQMLDADKLVAYLERRANDRGTADPSGLVISSVFRGLASRIRSGEFDYKVAEENYDIEEIFTDPGFEHHEPHCHLQHGLGGRCTCR